jgi:putative ABC transport system permease protein
VLAVPVSWYLVSQWLEAYAFRIDLDLFIWFIPILVLVVIALLTIGYQTTKAALANPVKALKSE